MATTPTNPGRPRFLRRRFLVDLPFQLSIVWRAVAMSIFLLAAVLIGLLLPIVRGFEAPGADVALAADAATVFLHLHRNLWWIALVCVALPALLALHHSHRVAGPLVRFKRILQQLGNGQLPLPLHTRKGDYLKVEVALLNEAVAHIGEHAARMRAAHRELCVKLADAVAAEGVQDDAVARQRLQAVTDAARTLEVALQQFQRVDEVVAGVSIDTIQPLAVPTTATATR